MSLIETFHIPLREVRAKFTWSELVLMGWRSREQTTMLKNKTGNIGGGTTNDGKQKPGTNNKGRRQYAPWELVPANLPERFYNEEGEVDLSRVTGNDAVKYLAAIGMHVPIGGGTGRV
jgi:hypothetical protein